MTKGFYVRIAIVIIMAIVGAYFYTILPDTIPHHWGFDGKADSFGGKLSVLLSIPLITLFITILFPILTKVDPKKENYKKFQGVWEILQYVIVIYMAYMYFVSIYVTLNPEVNINMFMMIGLGVLFIILGNYMGKIKQNFFVGLKFPWTLDNEEVWNKTHRLSGKIFVLGGIAFIINAFFQWHVMIFFTIIILLILFVPIIYSFLLHKKITNK